MGVSFIGYVDASLGLAAYAIGLGVSGLMSYRIAQMAHEKLFDYAERKFQDLDVSRVYLNPCDKSHLMKLVASVAIATLALIAGGACFSLALRCILPLSSALSGIGLGAIFGGVGGAIYSNYQGAQKINRAEVEGDCPTRRDPFLTPPPSTDLEGTSPITCRRLKPSQKGPSQEE